MSLLDNLLKDGTQIAVRKLMVAGGGYLISKGLADAATATKIEDGVGSLLLIGIAWFWSHAHLKNAKAQSVLDTTKKVLAAAVDVGQKAISQLPDPSKAGGLMQGLGANPAPPPPPITPPPTP